jgi:ankyrin repeat protein
MKLKAPYKFALLGAGLAVLVYAALVAARLIEYTSGEFNSAAFQDALMNATQENDLPAMRVLLWLGADPNIADGAIGFPPLSLAAYLGHESAVKLLLRHGANPNGAESVIDGPPESYRPGPRIGGPSVVSTFDRPVFVAALRGRQNMVALLRDSGADYDVLDAMFLADEPFVRGALAKDPKINARIDPDRARLLRMAVENNNIQAIELMLDLGFDPNERPEHGDTPLGLARRMHRGEIVALLEAAQNGPE